MTFDIKSHQVLVNPKGGVRLDLVVALMNGQTEVTTFALSGEVPPNVDEPKAMLRDILTTALQGKYNKWKKLNALETQAGVFLPQLETWCNNNVNQ